MNTPCLRPAFIIIYCLVFFARLPIAFSEANQNTEETDTQSNSCEQLVLPLGLVERDSEKTKTEQGFAKTNSVGGQHSSASSILVDATEWRDRIANVLELSTSNFSRQQQRKLNRKIKALRRLNLTQFHFDSAEQKTLVFKFIDSFKSFEQIRQFIEAQNASPKKIYYLSIFEAIISLYTSHLTLFLTDRQHNKLDLARYREILERVRNFDQEPNSEFSLYQIKRAIEGRFALQEFVDCI